MRGSPSIHASRCTFGWSSPDSRTNERRIRVRRLQLRAFAANIQPAEAAWRQIVRNCRSTVHLSITALNKRCGMLDSGVVVVTRRLNQRKSAAPTPQVGRAVRFCRHTSGSITDAPIRIIDEEKA